MQPEPNLQPRVVSLNYIEHRYYWCGIKGILESCVVAIHFAFYVVPRPPLGAAIHKVDTLPLEVRPILTVGKLLLWMKKCNLLLLLGLPLHVCG